MRFNLFASVIGRAAGAALIFATSALADPAAPATTPPPEYAASSGSNQQAGDTFDKNEIVQAVSGFFGVTAEAAAAAVERVFADNGRPNAYIKGSEVSAAIGVGLRYGNGKLQMKDARTARVYWQGPSIGFDGGANGAKVFTLIYKLPRPDAIYRRFPGVEGSAYFIGGIGVNYQRAEGITLAPMRAGVGFRLGANIGYLSYSRKRHILPF